MVGIERDRGWEKVRGEKRIDVVLARYRFLMDLPPFVLRADEFQG